MNVDWEVNKLANMSLNKVKVREIDVKNLKNNFEEVECGYNEEQCIEEANRCLNCETRPCVSGCPVSVNIPDFISAIREKDFETAYKKIRDTNSLPAVCGRVCPQEIQCEAKCVRGLKGEPVAIGRLERFIADWFMKNKEELHEEIQKKNKKVAVIGSGPAGISCAGDLAKMGYEVTIIEAFHTSGGVLMYGIPQFRLPKDVVKNEIENIKKLGVKIQHNVVVGKTFTIEELLQEYAAIFVGSGAGLPKFMDVDGEDLNGVYSANEFLTRINLMGAYKFPENDTPIKVGKSVCVVGGGNVAVDAARCAIRFGAKATILYRRSEKELPARAEEVEHAKKEGVQFEFLVAPTKVIGNEEGYVTGIECVNMELGEPDSSGRRSPVESKESQHIIKTDTIVVAIGQLPNTLIRDTTDNLEINKHGGIHTDENGITNVDGVFAGGDVVTGAATVILAMGAGKKAAVAIDGYIKSKGE